MQELNLPKTDLKIITKDGKLHVFDVLRRKYVALTPEEWVRQQFVHFLIGTNAKVSTNVKVSITANSIKLWRNRLWTQRLKKHC